MVSFHPPFLSSLPPATPLSLCTFFSLLTPLHRTTANHRSPKHPPQAQVAIAMSLIMFSQTFGGAVFPSLAETTFSNSLRSELPRYAPSINPEAVIAAGATVIREVVTKNELAGVLITYSKSVDRVFYLTAGAAVICFWFAWGMGWRDIRMKKQVVPRGGPGRRFGIDREGTLE